MARIPGSHWEGPILGSRDITEDMPAGLLSHRQSCLWWEDFLSADSYSAALWTETTVGAVAANAIALQDEPGGVLLVNAGTANSTGYGSVQRLGTDPIFMNPLDIGDGATAFRNGVIAWEARFKVDLIAGGTFCIGIGPTDTTIVQAAGTISWASSLAISMATGGVITARAGTTNQNLAIGTAVANTWHRVGMRFEWANTPATVGSVTAFLDGRAFQHPGTGTFFTGATSPAFALVNAAGALIDARIDYFWAGYKRDIV